MTRRIMLAVAILLGLHQYTIAQEPEDASTFNVHEARFKLRIIATAVDSHFFALRCLPPPKGRDGKVDAPGLSWRVHLLPFVGEPELYEAFHFDEPWDSQHNRKLLDRMPEVYRLGGEPGSKTRFQAVGGKSSILRGANNSDRKSNTILAVITGADRAVAWTKPEDAAFDAAKPRESLGKLPSGVIECVMADSRLLSIAADVKDTTVAALLTADGGEVVDADALRQASMPANGGNLLSAIKNVFSRGPRQDAVGRLKRIGRTVHNYHDVYRRFPVAERSDGGDPQGQSKLSWRVHLLPYLDQQPLYERFNLQEPWDSPHNKALLKFMPSIYRAIEDEKETTKTRIQLIVGEKTIYDSKRGYAMRNIQDGISNTLMAIQVGPDKAVPWTKPEDAHFDPLRPLACLGTIPDDGIPFVRVDGACMTFRPDVSPTVFSAMVTPRGGEVISSRELQRMLMPN